MSKLQKELDQVRSLHGDGSQLTSLQAELERLRVELSKAHAERKRIEEEHRSEKQDLEQVRCAYGCCLVRQVGTVLSFTNTHLF